MADDDGLAATWAKLETFLRRIYGAMNAADITVTPSGEPPTTLVSPEEYMSLYGAVYEYCVNGANSGNAASLPAPASQTKLGTTSGPTSTSASARPSRSSTGVRGGELYERLADFYRSTLPQTNLSSPADYLTAWPQYQRAAHLVEAVFHYLDRFWVPRERTEGRRRDCLHIYPLLWNLWDALVLVRCERQLLEWAAEQLTRVRLAHDADAHTISAAQVTMAAEASLPMLRDLFTSYANLSEIPTDSLLALGESESRTAIRMASDPWTDRLLPWYGQQLAQHCEQVSTELVTAASSPTTNGLPARLDVTTMIARLRKMITYELDLAYRLLGTGARGERLIKDVIKEHLLKPVLPVLCTRLREALGDPEGDPTAVVEDIYQLLVQRRSLLPSLVPAVQAGFLDRLRGSVGDLMIESEPPQRSLSTLISRLAAFFRESRRIIRAAWRGNQLMIEAADGALRAFISGAEARTSFGPRLGEHLARWVHRADGEQEEQQQRGWEGRSPTTKDNEETENGRDGGENRNRNRSADEHQGKSRRWDEHDDIAFTMTMLKFIDDKESFQRSYAALLATRLLHGEVEGLASRLLDELASSYGGAFVLAFRRMMTDEQVSRLLTERFRALAIRRRLSPLPSCPLSFHVLGAGHWPGAAAARERDASIGELALAGTGGGRPSPGFSAGAGPKGETSESTAITAAASLNSFVSLASASGGPTATCLELVTQLYREMEGSGEGASMGAGAGAHTKRNLHWSPSLSTVEVEAHYGCEGGDDGSNGSLNLILTLTQWAILSLLSNHPSACCTPELICRELALSPAAFSLAIGNLIRSQLILLTGGGGTNSGHHGSNSSPPVYKINSLPPRPPAGGGCLLNLSLEMERIGPTAPRPIPLEDHLYALQCQIVRLLKARGRASWGEVRTTMASLGSPAFSDLRLLTKCVSLLREKEFIRVGEEPEGGGDLTDQTVLLYLP